MSEQMQVPVTPSSCQTPGHHTALHRAAMVGNNDCMAALVQGGCAMDLQDRDGNTALHEVAWHGFSQCVKLLVKAGADIHVKNKAGNTALHLACQNAHGQTARILLLGGARPDTKNNMGDSCLHVAARYNNLALVKMLLNSLCSVSETNQVGDTALHVAAALNHKKTVQLLLEAGTDGNTRNKAGKTALDKARDNNHKDVALLLARAPQVLRFTRGRTIRKRRDRLKAERRSQSVTRLEILPKKDSSSAAEEAPSSEQLVDSATIMRTGLHHNHKALGAPVSPHSRHRRRRHRDLALDEDCVRRGENKFHRKKDLLSWDGELPSSQNGKTYQLYTLYRDKEGTIRQAPANGCNCKPQIKKLEGQLKANQEEMRLKIHNVQEKVNCRLGKMDRRNRHQIKVLDMLNQERVSAERKDMIYRIERRAAQGREEAEMRQQVAASNELKKWCMSQIQDMDVHVHTKPQYFKLLPSPSVDQSLADGDLESLPLLSVVSGGSTSSLATYVNVVPFPSGHDLTGPDQEKPASRRYFDVKVERSPDDYENTALFPLPAHHSSGLLLGSADLYWQPPGRQGSPTAAIVALNGEDCGSSSASSSKSHSSQRQHRRVRRREHSYDRQQRKHPPEPMGTCGRAGTPDSSTRILEFFIDRPPEPTFSQERNNLHAVEVTQRFFETVSSQLERWYERKILEAKQQTELRAQQDREQLLQRISSLEEEIEQLKTSGTQRASEQPTH
ncbi:ankyrin repeat domain-containing protein 6 [Myripristis murdjan]|uniref:ankyrin repeat domain-containing protein 6 n=1 Tax=Myripristis murdjan TaxID=586833 RepID=UPI0011761A3F|nr:ankyrin repeat domain-containing protein 6-like [Myripristis murdjan]